jgi:hypothetical protein
VLVCESTPRCRHPFARQVLLPTPTTDLRCVTTATISSLRAMASDANSRPSDSSTDQADFKVAAADVLSQPGLPKVAFNPIIHPQATKRKLETMLSFDPGYHLDFEEPESVVTMEDIGYSKDTGISNVAVSQPFKLFTNEAVQRFRDEVLSEQVMANCAVRSNIAACQVRGYASKYAPFTYDAWHNPEVLSIVSKIAGVDLIPTMDLEIGHINISVKSERQAQSEREQVAHQTKSQDEDDKPVVGWHNDSYPFVCVTMLSDCTGMVGGETALRTATGNIMKVRGPQMVSRTLTFRKHAFRHRSRCRAAVSLVLANTRGC